MVIVVLFKSDTRIVLLWFRVYKVQYVYLIHWKPLSKIVWKHAKSMSFNEMPWFDKLQHLKLTVFLINHSLPTFGEMKESLACAFSLYSRYIFTCSNPPSSKLLHGPVRFIFALCWPHSVPVCSFGSGINVNKWQQWHQTIWI